MDFYSSFIVAAHWITTASPLTTLKLSILPALPRSTTCFPALPRTRATGPLKTQKGGKISPAARQFPPSPLWEAVKPPLFNDDISGRNGRCLETPYYTYISPPSYYYLFFSLL